MRECNKLTKELLVQGYSAENFPKEMVRLPSSNHSSSGDPLDNFYGGFVYNRVYSDNIVYRTGCGKYVLGKNVISNMGFMGEEWCHENDNPVIRCPYDKATCPENDPRLHGICGGGACIQCFCVCHKTESPYDYENSFEKAEADRWEEREVKKKAFIEARGGRACERHMIYDERKREWRMNYEPLACSIQCYSVNGYCPILGRTLNKKRGNVYYDLKKTYVRHDGSLLDGEVTVTVEKGIRFFKSPCSMDICESFIKTQPDEILQTYLFNHSYERYMKDSPKVEVLNIRAESRPSRDLMQDLQDIRDGIEVRHASDLDKAEKARKKEKREKTKKDRILKLEKRLIKIGYNNLEPTSLDRVHADKWLGPERIRELEKERKDRNRYVQLTLFD